MDLGELEFEEVISLKGLLFLLPLQPIDEPVLNPSAIPCLHSTNLPLILSNDSVHWSEDAFLSALFLVSSDELADVPFLSDLASFSFFILV